MAGAGSAASRIPLINNLAADMYQIKNKSDMRNKNSKMCTRTHGSLIAWHSGLKCVRLWQGSVALMAPF